jgi:Fur family transcriptional regulator, zinc uptake regulator
MQEKTRKAVEKIERDLKSKGERFTPPRRKVMEKLLGAKTPMKAYDVVEVMGDAKPMTVYRALDFLVANGLAHRIESLNAYVACAESHCAHKDSQYLICDSCGRVEELHNHAIDDFIQKKLAGNGFTLKKKTMELHGNCAACG